MTESPLHDYLPAPAIALGRGPGWQRQTARYLGDLKLVQDQLAALYREFEEHPGFRMGYTRSVYDGGPVVYKVGAPATQRREVAAFEHPETYDGLPVAPCRMVYSASGVPILIMETVFPMTGQEDDLPEWMTRVDNCQIGRRADGSWAIFDAGNRLGKPGSQEGWMKAHPTPHIFASSKNPT